MSKHLAEKTRIYKFGSKWAVQYFWPYSGVMTLYMPTWQSAMDEACGIEKNRAWA